MEAMIGHRDGFGKALGLVIYATGPDRVHIPPVALRLGMHQRIAVHFGGRCEEESRTFRLREAEGLMGAERSHLERLDGQFQVVHRAGRAREVEHALEWPLHFRSEERRVGKECRSRWSPYQ